MLPVIFGSVQFLAVVARLKVLWGGWECHNHFLCAMPPNISSLAQEVKLASAPRASSIKAYCTSTILLATTLVQKLHFCYCDPLRCWAAFCFWGMLKIYSEVSYNGLNGRSWLLSLFGEKKWWMAFRSIVTLLCENILLVSSNYNWDARETVI